MSLWHKGDHAQRKTIKRDTITTLMMEKFGYPAEKLQTLSKLPARSRVSLHPPPSLLTMLETPTPIPMDPNSEY